VLVAALGWMLAPDAGGAVVVAQPKDQIFGGPGQLPKRGRGPGPPRLALFLGWKLRAALWARCSKPEDETNRSEMTIDIHPVDGGSMAGPPDAVR
jgi:hypothetical protein